MGKSRARTWRLLLATLAMLPLVACGRARHFPDTNSFAERFEAARREGSPGSEESTRVFVRARFIRGQRLRPELTTRLNEDIQRELRRLGFSSASTQEESDLILDCTVRGRWSHGGRTALISFLTLTIYTPITYPWVIEINLYDPRDRPMGDVYEKGVLTWRCFGVIFFPTTLYQRLSLLPRRWEDLSDLAARTAAGKMAGIRASDLN